MCFEKVKSSTGQERGIVEQKLYNILLRNQKSTRARAAEKQKRELGTPMSDGKLVRDSSAFHSKSFSGGSLYER